LGQSFSQNQYSVAHKLPQKSVTAAVV